jgi:Outer membrane protein beta-barrel domain
MVGKTLSPAGIFLFLAWSAPAGAQYPPPGAPAAAPTGTPVEGLYVTPRNGQTPDQESKDRYECHSWAAGQTGFDPTLQAPGAGNQTQQDNYRRAMSACLEARGYAVTVAAAAPPVIPPYVPPAAVMHTSSPAIHYHPWALQVSGGYTFTTGDVDQYLHDGPNASLGFTWYPSSTLPLGFRFDGTYMWFGAKNGLLTQNGTNYTYGHEDIYGGDADVQFDLEHWSTRDRFYLFGGLGYYRERIDLHQTTYQPGFICGYYACSPGLVPVETAQHYSTTPWRGAWNAGGGWEIAISDHASFFIEGRFLRIKPYSSKSGGFIPVRFGLRF